MLFALTPLRLALAAAIAAQDPAADLRAAVLLPTPAERREAALALSRRADVTLERWLELCRGFGAFDPPPPGVTTTRAALWTAEGPEETELVVYVPAGYDARTPAPLLLQMHWTGGDGRAQPDVWRGVADGLGMLVLAPSEPGENAGYTFSERERQATLSALRWARLRFNVDENRVFASGISRGGHLAWDLALRAPDLFAGLAPMIGGPRIMIDRAENNLRYLENVVHLPIRDLQGARDDEILVHNLRFAFERLAGWKAPNARLLLFPELGHWFELDAVDWPAFWGACVRDPTPDSVVRAFARPGEGRAFWLEVLAADREVQETFTPRVTKSTWERLDRFERLAYVQKEVDERTARLAGERTASRVKLAGAHVTAARVLYDDAMLPKREALVTLNRASVRRKVERSAEVLLLEFVERFDRTFLPVFEVEVP
jgi:dienelactone hydrolase